MTTDTTTITTRAEALAALGDLTIRERAAVRWLVAMAWDDARDHRRAGFTATMTHRDKATEYAKRAVPPKTVTRQRVVADPECIEVAFTVNGDGYVVARHAEFGDYSLNYITPERAAIIADLLANPTETVEVEP